MPWRFVQCVECKDIRPTIAKKPKCSVGPRYAKCMKRMKEVKVVQCRACNEMVDLTKQNAYKIPYCTRCGESLGNPRRINHPKRRTILRSETP